MWILEGSLEVKLPTTWTDGEAKKIREEKGRRKKMQAHEKVKSRNTVFFQCFMAQEGGKVGC